MDTIPIAFTSIVQSISVIIILYYIQLWWKRSRNLLHIPGPLLLPFLGNAHLFAGKGAWKLSKILKQWGHLSIWPIKGLESKCSIVQTHIFEGDHLQFLPIMKTLAGISKFPYLSSHNIVKQTMSMCLALNLLGQLYSHYTLLVWFCLFVAY